MFDRLQLLPGQLKPAGNTKAFGLISIISIIQKVLQGVHMPSPQGCITLLLDLKTLFVPVRTKQVLASKHRTDFGMMHIHTHVLASRHNNQQRLQRRAGIFNTAILEILQCHTLLRFDDIINTINI